MFVRRFIASEALDIKVFSTFDAVPASDGLLSPGARRPSPARAARPAPTESKLDDKEDPLEALRAAVRKAALSGLSKTDVLTVVNGLFL